MPNYLHPAETDAIGTLLPVDPTNPHDLWIPPDNLLYPNGPNYLDENGVAFTTICQQCGTYDFENIAQIVYTSDSFNEIGPLAFGPPGSFTLTPVPEPATFVLLLLAAILPIMVSLHRRRRV